LNYGFGFPDHTCAYYTSYYRNPFTLFSAIEVACGERDGNTDKLIAKFSHKESDSMECVQDASSEESR
jgi:hypothetical protein